MKFIVGDKVEIKRWDISSVIGTIRVVHDKLFDRSCLVKINDEPYISIWVDNRNLLLLERKQSKEQ